MHALLFSFKRYLSGICSFKGTKLQAKTSSQLSSSWTVPLFPHSTSTMSSFPSTLFAIAAILGCLVVFFSVVSSASGAQGPCHKNKEDYGKGVTCEKVVLPPLLCSKCKLKPFNKFNGHFFNCASIYDINDTGCQEALSEYVQLNKNCDPVRKRQVEGISKMSNKQGLDYFVYSVCEQCCDCVPHGAEHGLYNYFLSKGKLFDSRRGNCPAHARYDICKVFPEVRFFKVSSGDDEDRWDYPKICPHLEQWFHSPDSSQWLYKGWVDMHQHIERFLNSFQWAARCYLKGIWQTCAELEEAQKRL